MKKHLLGFIACILWAGSQAATFTVTTTSDAGVGSFRQAILDANTLAGTDNIIFNIGTGSQTITLLSSVNLTTAMNIDGSTQPGFSGVPLISIGGNSMFNITSVNSGTLNSMAFVTSSSSTAINVNSCSNWLFVNNVATGMSVALQFQGNNTTHTVVANNCSGSAYGIYMNGGSNIGHAINNNNLSNCTQWGLQYNSGTPASINSNTFTACNNALFLRGANTFTLSPPGSGGPNENVFGTAGIAGRQINIESSAGLNVSGFNFSSQALAPLNSRSPFLINSCSNGTFTNNIATGVNIALEIAGNNTTHTITANNCSGSAYGIYMNGGSNIGHAINNNNLSNCTQWGLQYNSGTPASINSNTFTACNNALFLRGANTFTLGAGNIYKDQAGTSIYIESCNAVNVSNTTTNGSAGTGILINASSNCIINNNSTCGRVTGIHLQGTANSNSISNSNIVSCVTGIQLSASSVNNTTITAVNLFNTTNINNSGTGTVITGTTSTNTSPIISVNSGTICSGSSFTMVPSGAVTYTFSGGLAVVSPTTVTNYSVTGTDANGCKSAIPAISNVVVNVCAPASALNFDGSDDKVNLGSAITSSLTGSTKISVEAWVKPTDLSNTGCIVGNYSTGVGEMQFLLRRSYNSEYQFWVSNGSNNWLNTPSIATPTLNVWQHVAGTWDGTVACIYVNGVLSGTTTPGITALGTAGGNSVWLGVNTINENYAGDIDEVRIWNVARTQCEINTYKNCEIPTTATGLLANYHFNQGVDAAANTTVTSLTDAAGANTGTLTGFALTTGTLSNWVAPGGVVSGSVTPANMAITVGSTVSNSVVCNGNSTTLSGTGANTYVWTNGVINALAFTPTVTNTYTVTGTNTLTGCTNTAVASVTVNALPTLSVNVSNVLCNGGATGSATVTATGGASPYTYLASNGATTAALSNLMTGTYNYTVTDANSCVKSQSLVITQPSAIVTTSAVTNVLCNGGTGSATVTASGGTSPYVYTASNGATVSVQSNLMAGTYNYTVTDANACEQTQILSITAPTAISVAATANNGTICAGASSTLIANATGGTGTLTYAWVSGPTSNVNTVTPTATGVYTVDVIDANNCTATSTVEVIVNALPTISVNSGSICVGQSFTMTPTGAATYTYSNGSDVVMPTADATYTIMGTDINGCENLATSSVTVNALPTISAVTNNTLLCTGETATLTVSGATTYTWSTTENTMNIAVSPTVQTTYTVMGTDANGCENTTTIIQDVSLCTGIAGVNHSTQVINVYPNPNTGLFVLELTTASKVTVTNALGQTVIADTFEVGKHNLDIHNESTGVYFVKVIENNKQQIIKVIKQ